MDSNGGATALLGRIIAKGTGKLLHDMRAKFCSSRSAWVRPIVQGK